MKKWLLSLFSLPLISSGLIMIICVNSYGDHRHPPENNSGFIKYTKEFNKKKVHEIDYTKYLSEFNITNIKSNPHLLGYGYDRSDTKDGMSVFNSDVKVDIYVDPRSNSKVYSYDTKNGLYQDLGLNYNMRFGFNHFVTPQQAQYIHDFSIQNSHQINVIFHAGYWIGERLGLPNKNWFTKVALQTTNNKKIFFNNYKNEYIKSILASRSVFFDLQIKSSTGMKNYQKIFQKISMNDSFLGIGEAIHDIQAQNNNLNISLKAMNNYNTFNVIPDNTNSILNNGASIMQLNNLFWQIRINTFRWIGAYASDNYNNPINPSEWNATSISGENLENYANLSGLFKQTNPIKPIINPHQKIITDLTKLNRYYDEKRNIKLDLKKISDCQKQKPSINPNLVKGVISNMNKSYHLMDDALSSNNNDFNNVFIKHDDTALLDDLNTAKQALNLNNNFSIVKKLDFMIHTDLRIESSTTRDYANTSFNLTFDSSDITNFNIFKDGSFEAWYKTKSGLIKVKMAGVTFDKGLININKLSYTYSPNSHPLTNYTTSTANLIKISWIKILDIYRSQLIKFNQFNVKNGYLPLNIIAQCYFSVNTNISTNPDVLFYDTL